MEIIVRTAFLTEQIKIGTDVRSTFGTEFRTVIKKLDSEKSDRGSKLYSALLAVSVGTDVQRNLVPAD